METNDINNRNEKMIKINENIVKLENILSNINNEMTNIGEAGDLLSEIKNARVKIEFEYSNYELKGVYDLDKILVKHLARFIDKFKNIDVNSKYVTFLETIRSCFNYEFVRHNIILGLFTTIELDEKEKPKENIIEALMNLRSIIELCKSEQELKEQVIQEFKGASYNSFSDYETAIGIMSLMQIILNLKTEEDNDVYIATMLFSINHAGDVNDFGYAFRGLMYIRIFFGYIQDEDFIESLLNYKYRYGIINFTDIEIRQIEAMIISKKNKPELVQKWFFNYLLIPYALGRIGFKIRELIAKMYEEYYEVDDNLENINEVNLKENQKFILGFIKDNKTRAFLCYEQNNDSEFILKFKDMEISTENFFDILYCKYKYDGAQHNIEIFNTDSNFMEPKKAFNDIKNSFNKAFKDTIKDNFSQIEQKLENHSKKNSSNDASEFEGEELMFLWIKNYKVLKDLNANFSNKYIFNLKKDENDNYELCLDNENSDFDAKFFSINNDNEIITSINTVLGENGAGKTTLIEFLVSKAFEQYGSEEDEKFVMVSKKRDKLYCYHNLENIIYKIQEPLEIFIYKNNNLPSLFNQTSMIYFSNIEGIHKEITRELVDKSLNIIDLSSEKLLNNITRYYRSFNNDSFKNIEGNVSIKNEPVSDYSIELINEFDLYKKIWFLYNLVKKYTEYEFVERVRMPYAFGIEIKRQNFKFDLLEKWLAPLKELSEKTECKDIIHIKLDEQERNGQIVINIAKLFEIHRDKKEQDIKKAKDKVYSVLCTCLETMINCLENNTITDESEGEISIDYSLYVLGLSTGENAKLNMLSRIFWLVGNENKIPTKFQNLVKQDQELKKNMILILDEGEAYLHPEWQRCFIYDLLEYLQCIFKHHEVVKNIQIILTTNSPFILSDLSDEQLIILERNEMKKVDENVTETKEKKIQKPFAQNIYKILKSKFFMKGSMGEYSRKTITSFMEENLENLKHEKIIPQIESKKYKYLMKIIGEPIITNRLHGLFSDKFEEKDNIEELKKNIEYYEGKLLQLKQKLEENEGE